MASTSATPVGSPLTTKSVNSPISTAKLATAPSSAINAAFQAERLKAEKLRKEAEWKKMTPSTYLSFIKGYDAFPCKTTITTNPSVIFDAVKSKDCAKVKQLLLSDGDINVVNTSGSSLCHEAVRTGEMAMLETVLAFHPGSFESTRFFPFFAS